MKVKEINYLDDIHKGIIQEYIVRVKKVMYFSTDNCAYGKYHSFVDLMDSVYLYSNNFYDRMLKDEDTEVISEFLFIIPNMMFYTTVGFLTALRNEKNLIPITISIENIARITEDATSELADVLIDKEEKKKILKELEILHLTKN
tara:strand:- start:524 stop:958 length:435 start_codon:yes stop_codon:yes gene_type:complete